MRYNRTGMQARLLPGCLMALLSAVVLNAAMPGDATRLADAAMAADNTAMRALLNQKVDVNVAQPDGTTALHWAARHGDLETANLLIRAGANVKAANRFVT